MATTKIFKIGLIQMSVPATRRDALRKAGKMIRQAAKKGARIVCLPELFSTHYFPQAETADKSAYAERASGETASAMAKLARELGIILIVPFYELGADGKYYNTALLFGERGKLLGRYHKVHLPHDPGFYEKSYFEHGRDYKVFATKYGKVAVLICYDQWFPEAARAARLAGAQIIFYPTALGDIVGYEPKGDWHDAWETAQRAHAIANSVYIAAVNRVGREGQMRFFGQSFVCDPFGKILKLAPRSKEEVLVTGVDFAKNKFFSEGWGFLRNRRPDTYKALVSGKLVENRRGLKKVPHYRDEIRALKGK